MVPHRKRRPTEVDKPAPAAEVGSLEELAARVDALAGVVDGHSRTEAALVGDIVDIRDHLERSGSDIGRDLAQLRADMEHVGKELDLVAQLRDRPAADRLDEISVSTASGPALGFVRDEGVADGGSYADFEAIFRGRREEVQGQQERNYADLAVGREPVLDLGCGRGEFLEVLEHRGIHARGVDLDESMVAEARARGLDAEVGDLFDALQETADESVGVVFSAQVIEHLAPDDMVRMLREVLRVLRQDGLAIIETVNPHCVRALRFFWLDRTHTIPVYPESGLIMAREAGFPAAVVVFPDGSGVLDDDLAAIGDFALVAAKDPRVLVDSGLISG